MPKPQINEDDFWDWTGQRLDLVPWNAEYAAHAQAAVDQAGMIDEFDEADKKQKAWIHAHLQWQVGIHMGGSP